jgi:hypothetical protein
MTVTKLAAHPPEIPFHPLAGLFELMEGEEFDALVADIKVRTTRPLPRPAPRS